MPVEFMETYSLICSKGPYRFATPPSFQTKTGGIYKIELHVSQSNTESTYFAAMTYYRKTLFGRGTKIRSVHVMVLMMLIA